MDYYLNRNIEPITYINDDGLVCYEEWRDVIGTYGHYKISDLGRVMSKLKKPLILKPFFSTSKYLTVDTHNKNSSINRLVAVAFIENTENKEQVNHKNKIKTDNRKSNLEWVTHRENTCHSKLYLKKSSKYIGVSKQKSNDKWQTHIRFKGNNIYLGSFSSEEEAYEARINFEKENNIQNKYL